DGLSDKTVEQLVDCLGISSVADLYTLTTEQLLTLEGFKQRKANNIVSAIEKANPSTWNASFLLWG
ncbi:MAG: hypothetical protein IJF10_02245, partial [Clostridia bacterium]|nr:hypothetical protein [Clostridia bacterium]